MGCYWYLLLMLWQVHILVSVLSLDFDSLFSFSCCYCDCQIKYIFYYRFLFMKFAFFALDMVVDCFICIAQDFFWAGYLKVSKGHWVFKCNCFISILAFYLFMSFSYVGFILGLFWKTLCFHVMWTCGGFWWSRFYYFYKTCYKAILVFFNLQPKILVVE